MHILGCPGHLCPQLVVETLWQIQSDQDVDKARRGSLLCDWKQTFCPLWASVSLSIEAMFTSRTLDLASSLALPLVDIL